MPCLRHCADAVRFQRQHPLRRNGVHPPFKHRVSLTCTSHSIPLYPSPYGARPNLLVLRLSTRSPCTPLPPCTPRRAPSSPALTPWFALRHESVSTGVAARYRRVSCCASPCRQSPVMAVRSTSDGPFLLRFPGMPPSNSSNSLHRTWAMQMTRTHCPRQLRIYLSPQQRMEGAPRLLHSQVGAPRPARYRWRFLSRPLVLSWLLALTPGRCAQGRY